MRMDQLSATMNCTSGRHADCYGYVAPLVYRGTRPCSCSCHEVEPRGDYNARDLAAATTRARASFNAPVRCYCPGDCGCRPRWSGDVPRNVCGCRQHEYYARVSS